MVKRYNILLFFLITIAECVNTAGQASGGGDGRQESFYFRGDTLFCLVVLHADVLVFIISGGFLCGEAGCKKKG